MEQNHTQFAAPAHSVSPRSRVTFLRCYIPQQIDPAPISDIFAARGHVAAEALICRSLEDIAYKLDTLQAALQSHLFDQVRKPARRIILVGAQIGLVDVALAAENVLVSAAQEDGVALSATLARLERAFDVAVTQVWQYGGYC